jgi:hypothetical protein
MLLIVLLLPQLAYSIHWDITTPSHKPVNCSQVASKVDIATVEDLIASAPVVVFGFGPCPCTDFARQRFDELGVCYAESVQPMLFTNNEPHLKYLQCKHGTVHSFTFIGGKLAGDSRGMIDSDTLSPEALKQLLKKADASYTCPKSGDQIHHPQFHQSDVSADLQLAQFVASATQFVETDAGGTIIEKTSTKNKLRTVKRNRASETTLSIATLASVGTLVFASMVVAVSLVVRRVLKLAASSSESVDLATPAPTSAGASVAAVLANTDDAVAAASL